MNEFQWNVIQDTQSFIQGIGFEHSWWRHQMETFSALLAICAGNSPVTGEFPSQRPVTRSFAAFFDLRLKKRLSKKSWGWWFQTLSCPLWRHCNVSSAECWTSVSVQCVLNPWDSNWSSLRLQMSFNTQWTQTNQVMQMLEIYEFSGKIVKLFVRTRYTLALSSVQCVTAINAKGQHFHPVQLFL